MRIDTPSNVQKCPSSLVWHTSAIEKIGGLNLQWVVKFEFVFLVFVGHFE